jgi:hypothetical protein
MANDRRSEAMETTRTGKPSAKIRAQLIEEPNGDIYLMFDAPSDAAPLRFKADDPRPTHYERLRDIIHR